MKARKPALMQGPAKEAKAHALVVVHERGLVPAGAADPVLGKHAEAFARAVEDGASKSEWFCTLEASAGFATEHLLLESAALGPWSPGDEPLKCAAARAAAACRKHSLHKIAFLLPEDAEPADATVLYEGAVLGDAADLRYKSKAPKRPDLDVAFLLPAGADAKAFRAALDDTRIVAQAVLAAREWVNAPNNELTPAALASEAKALAERTPGLACKVLDEKQLRKAGFELVYQVGRGCEHQPRVVTLEYKPKKPLSNEHLVLVGKGITFDTGGYSIKGRATIHKMNGDMAGAAAVIAAIGAIAALKVPIRCTAIVGAAHNAIDAAAYTPGSIIKSRSGKTVYIENTDAEGRLVLADLLDYAADLKADVVWDFATLTGAAMNALGPAFGALFTEDPALQELLAESGEATGDLLWPLPIWPEYEPALQHHLADWSNMSTMGQMAGATHAANFLRQFVKPGIRWAHVDMGGPARDVPLRYYGGSGATGYGVRLVVEAAQRLAAGEGKA